MIKEQIRDIYDDIKNKLEAKNVTLDQVIFTDLQMNPMMLVNTKGLQAALDKLGIVLTALHGDRILAELRRANNNKFECTYKDLIDYLTKRRVNVAFLERGAIDPTLTPTT